MWPFMEKKCMVEYELLPRSSQYRQKTIRRGSMWRRCGWLRHGQDTCLDREHAICRGWSEKLWLVLDALQIFALLWVTGCPAPRWRFPQDWCTGSEGVLVLNMDAGAARAYSARALNGTLDEASVGKQHWEQRNATWLIATPGVAVFLFIIYLYLLRTPVYNTLKASARFLPLLERTVLAVLYFVFLPWNLFVSRYSLCVEMQVVQEWQRTYVCGALHAVQMHPYCAAYKSCTSPVTWDSAVLWASMVLYVIGLPGIYAYLIASAVTFKTKKRHESDVRAAEAEFVLQLSSTWAAQHYPLFSSFTRPWIFASPLLLLQKIALAWAVSATYDQPDGDSIRDAIVLSMLVLWACAILVMKVFRLRSSQHVAIAASAVNLLTALARFLMSADFKTTIWYMLGLLLPLHHALLLSALLYLLGYYAWRPDPWPVTLRSIRHADLEVESAVERLGWWEEGEGGGGEEQDEEGEAGEGSWREGTEGVKGVLEKARGILLTEQLRTVEFVRCALLQATIRKLHTTNEVLRRAKHVLRFAVEDCLEDAILFHNSSAPISVYDYPHLTPLIPEWRASLDRRSRRLALAGPVRRRLLLKLFACRLFIVIRSECARRHARADAALSLEELASQDRDLDRDPDLLDLGALTLRSAVSPLPLAGLGRGGGPGSAGSGSGWA